MSGKINLYQLLSQYERGKPNHCTHDDLVDLAQSPVTKEILTEDGLSILQKASDLDTFRSLSNFRDRISAVDLHGTKEDVEKRLKTTAERAVNKLLYAFRNLVDGKDESSRERLEFSIHNLIITKNEIKLLRDYVSGKATLDDVIQQCNKRGSRNVNERLTDNFNTGSLTVLNNIVMLKPEIKEKIVKTLDSVKTFLGAFDSNHDGNTQLQEVLSVSFNDKEEGISLKDIAMQVTKSR